LKVTVQFFASVRELVGVREETLELANGGTVSDLREILILRHGEGFRNYVFDPKTKRLRPSLQFLVGDKSISVPDGLSTVLVEGCVFAIIPPVGGG
jgi:MoaD family protein